MAKAKRALRRVSAKRGAMAVFGPPADRKLTLEILKEMHHVVLDAATAIGVSLKDAKRALLLAGKDSSRRRPSERIMRANFGIAALLNRWRNDSRYRRGDGTPRVLSIRGRGATFATLARACVPQVPLQELVEMVCENAEVSRLEGGKIALLGSPVMMTPKGAEITLAALALRLRRLTQTILHNTSVPSKAKSAGRFERMVTGEMTEGEFREFAQRVRQPMQDLCDRIDAGIRQPRHARRKARYGGIGLYVFQDDGEDG